jgi:hypothetical protein
VEGWKQGNDVYMIMSGRFRVHKNNIVYRFNRMCDRNLHQFLFPYSSFGSKRCTVAVWVATTLLFGHQALCGHSQQDDCEANTNMREIKHKAVAVYCSETLKQCPL